MLAAKPTAIAAAQVTAVLSANLAATDPHMREQPVEIAEVIAGNCYAGRGTRSNSIDDVPLGHAT